MSLLFRSLIVALLITMCVGATPMEARTLSLSERLSGRILLQVERHGEAWYVDPLTNTRWYLGTASDAFALLRAKGLGIRHADVERYRATRFPARLAGRILLDVDDRGQAYYVLPQTLRAVRLGDAQETYQVLREQGLGITNRDLERISIAVTVLSPLVPPDPSAPTVPTSPQVVPVPVPAPVSPEIPLNALERQAFDQINQHRRSVGLSELIWSDAIADVARVHSQNMADGRVPFGHDGFDDRFTQLQSRIRISAFAENVAMNTYVDPVLTAVQDWLQSPGHRRNIENSIYTQTGIGIVKSGLDEYFLTQLFVKP